MAMSNFQDLSSFSIVHFFWTTPSLSKNFVCSQKRCPFLGVNCMQDPENFPKKLITSPFHVFYGHSTKKVNFNEVCKIDVF